MQIEATEVRRLEDWRRQYQAVGGYDSCVRSEVSEFLLCLGRPQCGGRQYTQSQSFRSRVNWRLRQPQPAPARGPRGLAVDADDLQFQIDERVQRRYGEVGTPHEDHAHGAAHSTGRRGRQNAGLGVSKLRSRLYAPRASLFRL